MPSARKRTIEVEVAVEDKTATKSLSNIEKATSKSAKAFSNMAKAVVGAFTIRELSRFVGDSIERAEQMNSAYAITEQVIKQTGGAAGLTAEEIKKLSAEQSNLTGIDKALVVESNNVLLTFKNVRDEVGAGNDVFTQASGLILDMATVMGTDAKSGAVQLGKALNDPITGLSALTRIGVTFNDQQKDQIKAMVAAGDTLGAQKIILREISSEFGGTAEASADASDKIANAFKNMKEDIGTQLLPALEDSIDEMEALASSATRVFIRIGELLGVVDPAAGAIARYSSSTGLAADSSELMAIVLGDLLKQWQPSRIGAEKFTDMVNQLFAASGITTEGLEALRAKLPELQDDMFFTEEAADVLDQAIGRRLAVTVAETADKVLLGRFVPALKETAGGIGDVGGEADTTTGLLKDLQDELRAAVDPAFALIKRHEEFVKAQQDYNTAVADFGPQSVPALEAGAKLLETQLTYNFAQEQFNTTFGPEGITQLEGLGAQAGLYGDEVQALIDLIIRLGEETRALPPIPSAGYTDPTTGRLSFHEGGVVPGPVGQERLALVKGGETVLPTHNPGFPDSRPQNIILQVGGRDFGKWLIRDGRLSQRAS